MTFQNGPDREEVWQALFELISASQLFVVKERKLRLWNTVKQEERPYICLVERDEDHTGGSSGPPPKRIWTGFVFTYTWAKGLPDGTWPVTLLNQQIQVIENALAPDNLLTGKQTLGGLVDQVWITGKLFKDPGDLDGDGVAIIPVSILVP